MTTMPAEGVVVPIYPTEAMLDAAHGVPVMTFEGKPVYTTSREAEAIYLAMLAARPAAPTQSAAQKLRDLRERRRVLMKLLSTGRSIITDEEADEIASLDAQIAALSQPEQSQ